MVKRMRVGECFGNYSRQYYDLEGSLDSVIELLSKDRDAARAAGWTNLSVVWDYGYSSDDVSWCIRGDRLETDEEEVKRLAIESKIRADRKKAKKDREDRERREYERLKKKFEDK